MSDLLYAARPILMDFASTIAFAVLMSVTHDLGLSVGISVAIAVVQLAWRGLRREKIELMQWASLGLVLVFGGAAFLTHDARFVLFKPTVIYLAIGAVMMKPGWLNRYVPPVAREHVSEAALTRWGYAWATLMFATAAVNAGLAIHGDLKLWAAVMAVVPAAGKIGLFAVQYAMMRHGVIKRILRAGTEAQPA